MLRIVEGVGKFQRHVYPQHRELFEDLASSQNPDALLITCADSRIDPCLLTQTRPGELFICRNAGNIVPAYGDAVGGVSATIEFAVTALGVRDIIICGHSDCGAMKGILHPDRVASMPAVAAWLRYGDAARVRVLSEALAAEPALEEHTILQRLTEWNVVTQMRNLETHPAVAAGIARGETRIHGWIYDIGAGEVRVWDAEARHFQPLPHDDGISGTRHPLSFRPTASATNRR